MLLAGIASACSPAPGVASTPPVITQVVVATLTDTPTLAPTATLTPTPSLTPTPTITPTPAPGEPEWVEDFNDNTNNWETYQGTDVRAEVRDGSFVLTFLNESFFQWASLPQTFQDVQLQVVAQMATENHMAGAICRLQDADNFYLFSISKDRFFRVLAYINGQPETLLPWSPSFTVQPDGENTLDIACLGDRLTLHINGELVANVVDGRLDRGQVALAAASYAGRNPVSVRFERVTFIRPNYNALPPLPTPDPNLTATAIARPTATPVP